MYLYHSIRYCVVFVNETCLCGFSYIQPYMCICVYIDRITRHLGSGQFGTVNEGVWQSPNGLMSVAIKMLAENSNEEQKVKLLQEAAIMGQFCHPNVIRLHGVVTVGEPVS